MAPIVFSYDLFLSYNSANHGIVEDVARRLRAEGLKPFLDRWYLAPGARWRTNLEKLQTRPRPLQSSSGRVRWVPGSRERWMSHSTFRVGAPISPSYRYYSLAANLHWVFF